MTRKGHHQRRTDASPLAKTPVFSKGGGEMVTYENLFAFALVIIETITLVVVIFKNNK